MSIHPLPPPMAPPSGAHPDDAYVLIDDAVRVNAGFVVPFRAIERGAGAGDRGDVRVTARRLLGAVALALTAGAASAADVLSLDEAYRLAAAYDARFAAAHAARAAGREKGVQGRAALLPTLSLAADTTHNDLDVTFQRDSPFLLSGTRRYNSNRYGVVLRQPLYRQANLAQYRQSLALASGSETAYAVAQQDLILRVAQGYFDALLAEDTLAYLEAQLAAVTALRDRARRAFDAGTAAVTDLREAEARYDLVGAQAIGARNELALRQEALAKLLGRAPGRLAGLRAPPALAPPAPDDADYWVQAAERTGLAVALARDAVEAARQELAARRGVRYPAVDLAATYVEASEDDSLFGVGFDTTTRTIGVQAQMPLYAGGALVSQVREAAAREAQARHELNEAVRQARLDARDAYLRLTTGLSQAQAFEQAVRSIETSLAATERGLAAGTRTAADVLNAQQQLYGARRELAQARYGVIVAGLRLKAVVGELGADEVLTVDALLDNR